MESKGKKIEGKIEQYFNVLEIIGKNQPITFRKILKKLNWRETKRSTLHVILKNLAKKNYGKRIASPTKKESPFGRPAKEYVIRDSKLFRNMTLENTIKRKIIEYFELMPIHNHVDNSDGELYAKKSTIESLFPNLKEKDKIFTKKREKGKIPIEKVTLPTFFLNHWRPHYRPNRPNEFERNEIMREIAILSGSLYNRKFKEMFLKIFKSIKIAKILVGLGIDFQRTLDYGEAFTFGYNY